MLLIKGPKAVFSTMELFDFKFQTNDQNIAFDTLTEVGLRCYVL
jgi:hypothetical protein